MQKENIWKLLARKMTGEATDVDLKELESILESDPVMQYTAETFIRLWNTLPIQPASGNNPAMSTCKEE